ncbi:hypothetical protein LGQ02_05665 [Bacillus shivajii]|uniref:phasin family protein n=1 Tax=Bacillus shivajii TaxID=1983719 RepID=UPI001CFA04BB|nr:hypothetical protein [Bacillus shivajii]UCZ54250.1 hypothetical protein LGQ02_05665 [Bacillus shivajii]
MNDLLKKGFLLGLGAAVTSKEKVERYLQELVSKGRVTPKEAEELYDSLVKKGEETEEQWTRRSKDRARTMMDDLGIVSKEEHEVLQSRVIELEKRVAELSTQLEHKHGNELNNSNDQ